MNITVKELLEKTKYEKVNIIDIRNKNDYNLGHIKNAKNISLNSLLALPEYYLNKSELYYIYCQYGNLSKNVVNNLNNKGYQAINVIGGYNSYKE